MNKNVIIAFVVAIVIFSLFAIYGLVNQDYLKSVDMKKNTTTVTTAKTMQTCTKEEDNKKYKYTFYLTKDRIDKLNISYENTNNADEFNILKGELTSSLTGITNKHLLGTDEKYVFTFDVANIDESINESTLVKQLNITLLNTIDITEYINKLNELSYTC